ncbi:MAG: helix-turn-helix domain-containing protein [Desulfovermiculus sp.]
MDIKQDIKQYLKESGWSASRLAREAGVATPVITRLMTGERKGIHSQTLSKLWPFLYGDTITTAQSETQDQPTT